MTDGDSDRGLAHSIRARLDDVIDPCSAATGTPIGLDAMGLVKDVTVADGHVNVAMRLTTPSCLMHGYFIDAIDSRLRGIDGVRSVNLTFDRGEEWEPRLMREDVLRRRDRLIRERFERISCR